MTLVAPIATRFSPDIPLIGDDVRRACARLPNLPAALDRKHLLLTGGTGFFGRWLLAMLAALRAEGVDLRVSVLSRDPARFLAVHDFYRDARWLSWIRSDIRSPELVLPRFDLLLHAATDTSTSAHRNRLDLYESILEGTRNILKHAVYCGVERVLLVGSGAQYGRLDAQAGPVREDTGQACASEQADSAYGEAKRAAETLAAIHAERHGFQVVHARCFAFSGAGLPLDAHFAIGNFVRDALRADAIRLASHGLAVRSYLHGADLAAWLLQLLVGGSSGQAYNVGSDQAISIADLARRVATRLAPGKSVLIGTGAESGPRSFYVPDIGKARLLGLDVWTSLDASVDNMARWASMYASIP